MPYHRPDEQNAEYKTDFSKNLKHMQYDNGGGLLTIQLEGKISLLSDISRLTEPLVPFHDPGNKTFVVGSQTKWRKVVGGGWQVTRAGLGASKRNDDGSRFIGVPCPSFV
jgi:hypothetical protein